MRHFCCLKNTLIFLNSYQIMLEHLQLFFRYSKLFDLVQTKHLLKMHPLSGHDPYTYPVNISTLQIDLRFFAHKQYLGGNR